MLDPNYTVSNVCVGEIETGMSEAKLRDLRNEIPDTNLGHLRIDDALDLALSPLYAEEAVEILRRQGRYLLGATSEYWPDAHRVEGLLFLQGEDMQPNGAFSLVRMATWLRPTDQVPQQGVLPLQDILVLPGLEDVNAPDYDPEWSMGAPVDDMTRIEPYDPREEAFAPVRFAQVRDTIEIRQLGVDDRLKELLLGFTAAWHEVTNDPEKAAYEEWGERFLSLSPDLRKIARRNFAQQRNEDIQ